MLYSVAWLGAALGVVVPDAIRRGWQVPVRWRVPLACWAAGVCATAPIIALRAVDFRSELLFRGRLPFEMLSDVPLLTVGWTLHVALLLAIGVLWFDWLCGTDEEFLVRWVITPMGISALMLGVVAGYQMFVDVTFLNPTVYANIHRASGTMMDANVSGVLAAMWIGGWAALVARGRRLWLLAAPVLLLWLAVWATGSRTGFASAAIVSVLSLGDFIADADAASPHAGECRRGDPGARDRARRRGAPQPARGRSAHAIHQRYVGCHPRRRARDPCRTVESQRIWVGGHSRHRGLSGLRYRCRGVPPDGREFGGWLPPDNAQNWYRHQLVELGVVGSIGWDCLRVVVRLVGAPPARGGAAGGMGRARRDHRHRGDQPARRPWGQDPGVAFTFWTMAGWFLAAAGKPQSRWTTPPPWTWAAASIIVIALTAGTVVVSATGPLRLPVRIQRAGGEYLYGFYWPEPDGAGGVLVGAACRHRGRSCRDAVPLPHAPGESRRSRLIIGWARCGRYG
ncbi:MAG: hypothetical protein QM731_29395 [Chitinophagaceae bacterium]